MALKTWPDLDDKELVAHAEVRDAVNRGILEWWGDVEPNIPTDNTGLNPDNICYTRSDFESYVNHVDMSGSGIEMGEYMSKSEMLTYRMISIPILTSASWIRSNIQLCPSLDETHCVRWDGIRLTKPGYHVAIYRSVNGGSFSKVMDNVSPTSTPNCIGGTGTYGTSLNLLYGLDTGFIGNFNDFYLYQVRIEEDGTDNVVSTATTAIDSSLHSDCSLQNID